MKRSVIVSFFFIFLVFTPFFIPMLPASEETRLELSMEYPQVGTMMTVTLVMTGDDDPEAYRDSVLLVEYRPNSETSSSVEVPSVSPGMWQFSPERAGLITMKVVSGQSVPGQTGSSPILITRNVSIRYSQPPLTGVLVMVIAGVLLFGGIAVSFWQGMHQPDMTGVMPLIDT